jgi:hypothetical protein
MISDPRPALPPSMQWQHTTCMYQIAMSQKLHSILRILVLKKKNEIYGVKSCFLGLMAIFGIRNILVNDWILLSNFL